MSAYYNEFDPYAAQWLRNLIAAGLIASGDVDERDIREVKADDVRNYTQCHFFAGIGGWSRALRLAGWPDDRPVWTGSCPCQPFSAAGKRRGTADERHLWPDFFRLIAECRPAVVFGEQVEAAIRLGWLDGIFADLEGKDYACGAHVLGAHSVGAPHIRQRLWWAADCEGDGRGEERSVARRVVEGDRAQGRAAGSMSGGDAGGLGDADRGGSSQGRQAAAANGYGRAAVADGGADGLAFAEHGGREGRDAERRGPGAAVPSGSSDFWSAFDLVPCADGKARRAQSAAQRLVDGLPGSLGPVRADIIAALEAEVIAYGAQTGADPRAVVRDLWQALLSAAEPVRRLGERAMLFEEALLFALLCQLAQQGWPLAQGISRAGAEVAREAVRVLWHGSPAARPSCERGLAGQQSGQSPDPVHLLSPVLARYAQAAWNCAYPAHAAAVFPLIVGAPARVGRLRAYGNAIVGPLAAEFVKAYLECRP
jgi:site-specific DNA-cytosine methylase